MAKEISPQDQPNQSADRKYYKNRDNKTSCLQRTIADSTLKNRFQLKPNATPRRVDPKFRTNADLPLSADVYYANDGKAQVLDSKMPAASGISQDAGVGPIIVTHESKIREGIAKAISRLQMGDTGIKIGLADAAWVRKARTALEFAVTREEITEDQGREISFGVARQVPEQPLPAVTPHMPVPGDEKLGGLFGDPTQFVTKEDVAAAVAEMPKTPSDITEKLPTDAEPLPESDVEPEVEPEVLDGGPDSGSMVDDSDDDSDVEVEPPATEPMIPDEPSSVTFATPPAAKSNKNKKKHRKPATPVAAEPTPPPTNDDVDADDSDG